MNGNGEVFSSGNWMVKPGEEARFVELWTGFTRWSHENAPGAGTFFLLRDDTEPRHFISFARVADRDSVGAWRQNPEFQELLGRCRDVCEDFRGGDYSVAAEVG